MCLAIPHMTLCPDGQLDYQEVRLGHNNEQVTCETSLQVRYKGEHRISDEGLWASRTTIQRVVGFGGWSAFHGET